MKPKMKRESFTNVWEAIEDDPAVAANMTMRSDLLIALQRRVGEYIGDHVAVHGYEAAPSEDTAVAKRVPINLSITSETGHQGGVGRVEWGSRTEPIARWSRPPCTLVVRMSAGVSSVSIRRAGVAVMATTTSGSVTAISGCRRASSG